MFFHLRTWDQASNKIHHIRSCRIQVQLRNGFPSQVNLSSICSTIYQQFINSLYNFCSKLVQILRSSQIEDLTLLYGAFVYSLGEHPPPSHEMNANIVSLPESTHHPSLGSEIKDSWRENILQPGQKGLAPEESQKRKRQLKRTSLMK